MGGERARQRISVRIRRVSLGNFGDVMAVGEGVSELRIDYGPGYRVHLVRRSNVIILCGGDKHSQDRDIAKAKRMAEVSRETGLSRGSLYRALSEDGNPTLTTVLAVAKALGISLSVGPAGQADAA